MCINNELFLKVKKLFYIVNMAMAKAVPYCFNTNVCVELHIWKFFQFCVGGLLLLWSNDQYLDCMRSQRPPLWLDEVIWDHISPSLICEVVFAHPPWACQIPFHQIFTPPTSVMIFCRFVSFASCDFPPFSSVSHAMRSGSVF